MSNCLRNIILLLPLLLFRSSTLLYGDLDSRDPRMEKRLIEFEERLSAGDRTFPDAELRELAAYLRKHLKLEEDQGRDGYAFIAFLIKLGDETTIQERVRTEADIWRWRDYLIQSGSPYAIEALAPALMAGEPARHRFVGDVVDMSTSHQVAAGILPAIIENCPQVSADVRAWAHRFLNDGPAWNEKSLDSYRSLMREWWRENARFLRERNYAAVKRGRLIVKTIEGLPQPQSVASTPAPVPEPGGADEPGRVPAAVDSALKVSVAAERRGAVVWPWFIGIAVLAIAGLFFWRHPT